MPDELSDINITDSHIVYIPDVQEIESSYYVCFGYYFRLEKTESDIGLYYSASLSKIEGQYFHNDNEQEIRYLLSTESFYKISFDFAEEEKEKNRSIFFIGLKLKLC